MIRFGGDPPAVEGGNKLVRRGCKGCCIVEQLTRRTRNRRGKRTSLVLRILRRSLGMVQFIRPMRFGLLLAAPRYPWHSALFHSREALLIRANTSALAQTGNTRFQVSHRQHVQSSKSPLTLPSRSSTTLPLSSTTSQFHHRGPELQKIHLKCRHAGLRCCSAIRGHISLTTSLHFLSLTPTSSTRGERLFNCLSNTCALHPHGESAYQPSLPPPGVAQPFRPVVTAHSLSLFPAAIVLRPLPTAAIPWIIHTAH